MTQRDTRILVIADTHNHLPRDLETLARDVDEIWHLGDVVNEELIDEIRTIGPPLKIVRGNCDYDVDWPLAVDVTRNGVRLRLQHIPPPRPPKDCDVLLHGHTHVPRSEVIGGVRFLNPGCVTRPNRGAPASVAHLTISANGELDWRL